MDGPNQITTISNKPFESIFESIFTNLCTYNMYLHIYLHMHLQYVHSYVPTYVPRYVPTYVPPLYLHMYRSLPLFLYLSSHSVIFDFLCLSLSNIYLWVCPPCWFIFPLLMTHFVYPSCSFLFYDVVFFSFLCYFLNQCLVHNFFISSSFFTSRSVFCLHLSFSIVPSNTLKTYTYLYLLMPIPIIKPISFSKRISLPLAKR